MHMNLSSRLQAREADLGRPVRSGLAGAGQMGIGFVAQVQRIPGMEVAAIADVLPGRPQQAFAQAPTNGVVEGDDPDKLAQAVADGRPVGVTDARLLIELPVDVVVDATGVPDVGALLSYAALTGGKDVASLNAEADVTIGLLLSRVAHASGQVYALCKGDEPVEVKELFDYGMSMSVEEVSRLERAAGYAIPGVSVDGNDVQAVYQAVTEAVAHARAGRGPTLVEAITYRWKGHSKSDQNLYRTREEIESWRERDPIDRFEQAVLEARTLDEAEIRKIRDEARDAVRDAVRTGQSGPPPSADLLAGVYAPSEVDALTVAGGGAPASAAPAAGSASGPVAAAAGTREEAEAP
jgi:Dehydrogenase E1 component